MRKFFKNVCYWVTVGIIWLVFHFPFLYKVRIKNIENIDERKPIILAFTHKSWLDIPVSSLLTWRTRKCHRYVAKKELFRFPVSIWLNSVGAIPVDRHIPGMSTFKQAKIVLEHREVVVIFPEGTRFIGEGLGTINDGIATIALLSRVDPSIIPISITYKKGWFLNFPIHISMKCGEPIETSLFCKSYCEKGKARKGEIRSQLTEKIRNSMQQVHSENII